jgi:hypothetical protein
VLAKALTNAVLGYVRAKKPEESERLLGELRELYEDYREREVREELAGALTNAVLGYVRAKKPEESERLLGELRELYEDYREREVRVVLAKALTNAVLEYAEANKPEKIGELLEELEELFRLGLPATEEVLKLVHLILRGGMLIVLDYSTSYPKLSSHMLRLMLLLADERQRQEICGRVRAELDRLLREGKLSREAHRRITEVCG